MRKIVNGMGIDYTLQGKQVVHLKKGGDNLHFFYDAQGRPAVVDFNGVRYGYVHNLKGDIVAIIDGRGNQVVEYTYDAWGKPLTKTGTLAISLGTLNPFRYRGYVYDEETGLYYLRSRYYNPVWCRFLNADTVYRGNLYTYCSNRPVSSYDPAGRKSKYALMANSTLWFPNYTKIIDERLAEAVAEFKNRSVGDGGPSSLGQMASNFENYWWFYKQVDHNGPWDIKENEPWRRQFPTLPILTKFVYRDKVISREDLGNFTYGYLGTAMGVHSEFLYQMGGAAAFTKGRPLNPVTIMDAYSEALYAGEYYGDSEEDHLWISYGIDAYNAWKVDVQ